MVGSPCSFGPECTNYATYPVQVPAGSHILRRNASISRKKLCGVSPPHAPPEAVWGAARSAGRQTSDLGESLSRLRGPLVGRLGLAVGGRARAVAFARRGQLVAAGQRARCVLHGCLDLLGGDVQRVVAGGQVAVWVAGQWGLDLAADVGGAGAARVEDAARGRVDRVGRLAAYDDPLAATV